MAGEILEPTVLDTIERYFDLLQAHAAAQQMLDQVLTPDFETGFADGHRWRGSSGLIEFLDDRSVFFDESHEILQVIDVARPDPDIIRARTRLRFFLRRREHNNAVSQEFTGQAFHSWLLRRDRPGGQWRVAAQIVDGFAQLNANAIALFAAPAEGLQT
jgi:hypothetical protein